MRRSTVLAIGSINLDLQVRASLSRDLRRGLAVQSGTVVTVEKLAALYSSRDVSCSEPLEEAESALRRAASFELLLAARLCIAGAYHTLEPGGQKLFALPPSSPRGRAPTPETGDAESEADDRQTTTSRTR